MPKILQISVHIFLIALYGCAPSLEHSGESVNANVNLGIVYLQQGNLLKARIALNQAVQSNPNCATCWSALGYLEEISANYPLAENYYLRAIKLAPHVGEVYNNYGVYLCRQGQYQAGIRQFLIAAELPFYIYRAAAWENAGLCALLLKNKALAITYFKAALNNDPHRPLPQKKLSELIYIKKK